MVFLVPLLQLAGIEQEQCFLYQSGFVFVKANKQVEIGLASRIRKRDDILEDIVVVQKLPPKSDRLTPPPPDA